MSQDLNCLDRLQRLRGWIQDGTLENAARAKRLGEALVTVEAKVKAAWPGLRQRCERIEGAKFLLPKIGEARERIEAVAQGMRLEGGVDSPDGLEAWVQMGWPAVVNAVTHLYEKLQAAWKRECEALETRAKALGRVLERLPATRDLGTEILRIGRQAGELGGRFPDEAARGRLEDLARRLEEVEQRLHASGGTEEVQVFLLKAVEGQASLEDLSPPVWEWLRSENLLGRFRVRLE